MKPPFGASLHIYWPKVKKNGKWLLYLVSITSEGPEKIHCSPESEINPLSISQVALFLPFTPPLSESVELMRGDVLPAVVCASEKTGTCEKREGKRRENFSVRQKQIGKC